MTNELTGSLRLTRVRLYEALVVLGFVLLCGFDLWHHSMWRDEIWPWLFARDSPSIPELLHNLRYEPHPRLWYLVLYGVAHISHNPAAEQVAHLLIISSAMFLFVRNCPLPFYIKAVTTFGYLFVYEWGAISRNYALGVLLCFAFCSLFPKRDKGWIKLAAVLFLACQANQLAALIAAALGGLLMLEAYMDPEVRSRVMADKLKTIVSLLLIYGGLLLGFASGIPARDEHSIAFYSIAFDPTKILHAFGAIWDGFVPFPEPTLLGAWGWGMTGHWAFGPVAWHAIYGMILLPFTILFFWRSRLILCTYLGGVGLLLMLAYVQTDSYARHAGHFFLWFIICTWLAHYFPASSAARQTTSKKGKKSRGKARPVKPRGTKMGPFGLSTVQAVFFCLLLVVPIYDTIFLSVAGYYYPFSCGKEVSLYLRQHNLDKLPILGYPDYAVMPVSGYAYVPIYYADPRWGTFQLENNKRRTDLTVEGIFKYIADFAAQGHNEFIVLLNSPFTMQKDGRLYVPEQVGNLHLDASFYPCMVMDEIYWVYHYRSIPAPGPGNSAAMPRNPA